MEWVGWNVKGTQRDEKTKHDVVKKKNAWNTRWSLFDLDWRKGWMVISRVNYGSWWRVWSLLWCEFEGVHNLAPCLKTFTYLSLGFLLPVTFLSPQNILNKYLVWRMNECLKLDLSPEEDPKILTQGQVVYLKGNTRKPRKWDKKGERNPKMGMLISRLPLWAPGAYFCWGPLRDDGELPNFISWGLLPRASTPYDLPLEHAPVVEKALRQSLQVFVVRNCRLYKNGDYWCCFGQALFMRILIIVILCSRINIIASWRNVKHVN